MLYTPWFYHQIVYYDLFTKFQKELKIILFARICEFYENTFFTILVFSLTLHIMGSLGKLLNFRYTIEHFKIKRILISLFGDFCPSRELFSPS